MTELSALQPAPEIDQEKSQPELEELLARIGVRIPEITLPRPGTDLTRWSVVACDQYTSQPEYWARAAALVGDQPSTLKLTLPEIYLGKPGEEQRIRFIQAQMQRYLESGVLEPHVGMMYVERTIGSKQRRGLVLCLDLEKYDYTKGASSLIRATEGTIVDRLPPRIKIRQGAALEFPHILVLIDDPGRTVIEPLAQHKERLVARYDFDLMFDSGHLSGWQIADPDLETQVVTALHALTDPDAFRQKYDLDGEHDILLFAMGDGNHSLATAKAIWEGIKGEVGPDHPARYALVEIENVHDEGLEFEAIHRVLFGFKEDLFEALRQFYGPGAVHYTPCADCVEMMERVDHPAPGVQAVGLTYAHHYGVIELSQPLTNLAVGTIQAFLDHALAEGRAEGIDYVHGKCVICKLTAVPHHYGFFLPDLPKNELFKTVILDGALPRKTFSMGEAHEKRFYLEGRRIA
jgi:hypothetical protein